MTTITSSEHPDNLDSEDLRTETIKYIQKKKTTIKIYRNMLEENHNDEKLEDFDNFEKEKQLCLDKKESKKSGN